jgi:hypothetical protein
VLKWNRVVTVAAAGDDDQDIARLNVALAFVMGLAD